jgi:hypothetical protein
MTFAASLSTQSAAMTTNTAMHARADIATKARMTTSTSAHMTTSTTMAMDTAIAKATVTLTTTHPAIAVVRLRPHLSVP